MKKLLTLLFTLSLLLTGCDNAPKNVCVAKLIPIISYDDYVNTLSKEDFLNYIIELPTSDYDINEANVMIGRISNFDIKILKSLYLNNIPIMLVNTNITEVSAYSFLKGVVPRGWEDTDSTWDDVPGGGGNPTVIRIGYSFPSVEHNHGSIILELHETAHAVDQFVFNNISSSEEFIKIHNAEVSNLFPGNSYYDYPEEYFAECMAMYVYTPESLDKLKRKAPLTYDFFVKIINELP